MEYIDGFVSLDYKILFSSLGGIFTLFFVIIFRAEDKKDKKTELLLKEIVTNDKTIKNYQEQLNQELKYKPSIYRTILYKTLGLLDQRLGEWRLFSTKAFKAHFYFSLIYSFFFFYLVWLFGGTSQIGNITLFTNPDRLITSLYLIFEIVIIYLLFRYDTKIVQFISNKLSLSIKYKDIIEILIYLVVVGAVVVVGVVGAVGVGVNEDNISLIIFFLILPLINASFDYISMIVSRYYSQKMLKDTKIELLGHLLIDLLIAIVLLILLAYSLYAVVELTNIYFIKKEELFIPIEAYKHQLLIDPFARDVLWITLMFVSTLIPTLLHLILGLYSLLAMIIVKPHLHNLDKELKEINFENNLQKKSICEGLAQYELASSMKWYIFTSMFLILLSIFVMYIISIKMVGGS